MGIGPQGLGSAGMKKGVHACGTPMNKSDMTPLTRSCLLYTSPSPRDRG